MTDQPEQLLASSTLYLPIALKCAIVASFVEAPVFFVSTAAAPIVFPAGWTIIFAYTFYKAWQLNTQYLCSNDFDVSKFVAGVVLVGLASAALFGALVALSAPAADDVVWLIKAAFISNPVAGIDAALIAASGAYVVEKILARMPSREFRQDERYGEHHDFRNKDRGMKAGRNNEETR
jgi:hypothetical protein